MQERENNEGKNSIKDITTSLERVLGQIQAFTPGDSIYSTMKSGKRGRGKQDQGTSPESSSPPKKTGRTGKKLRSITKSATKKKKEPTPGTSKGDQYGKESVMSDPEDFLGTPLTSTPATSISSIPESLTSNIDQLDVEETVNRTVIHSSSLPDPKEQGPTIVLSGPNKYTVETGFIDYITGKSPVKPKEFTQIIRLWYQDQWNNLENPPDNLTSSMFLVCIPLDVSNREKIQIMMAASNNLEMARLNKRYVEKDPELFSKDFKDWLPFADIYEPSTKEPEKQPMSIIQDQFLLVTKELLDTVRVLQKDIDRNAFLFRSVCVDTAQGLREGGERMIKEVKAITGLVATSTTPIGAPTKDKSTTTNPTCTYPFNQTS